MDNEDYISEYLKAAFESGDISEITRALGDVARSRNMTDLAERMGISRQGLYKTLSENGNPEFATIQKLITALGLQLSIIVPLKTVGKQVSSISPSYLFEKRSHED
jgi:probable addiction module antidote protein